MRKLTDHIVEGDLPQNQLTIEVTDEPGAGGANHRYEITGFDTGKNQSSIDKDGYHAGSLRMLVLFQNGPIQEAGVNGITQEALLAIVIDRLRSFQAGPYPSPENKMAMGFCELALEQLQIRTKNRLARGVEGKTEA
jgi:hypothetical protein